MTETRAPEITAGRFRSLFGAEPLAVSSARGRVNLIGEHTDYNGGFVLPTLIPQATTRRAGRRRRAGACACGAASSAAAARSASSDSATEESGQGWLDYVQGVTVALRQAGFEIGGFDLAHRLRRAARQRPVVERGARGVAAARAAAAVRPRARRRAAGAARHGPRRTSSSARRSASWTRWRRAWPDEREALFLDTRTLDTEHVPLPRGAELVVINSGVAHHHAHGDYRTRRAECERAAALLGVAELRDVGGRRSAGACEALPEPLDRRARHVVTENERVLDAVAAMRAGDAARARRAVQRVARLERDDYECSVPEIDLLVEIAAARARRLRRAAHRRRLRRLDRRAGPRRARRGRRRAHRRVVRPRVRSAAEHPRSPLGARYC